MNATGIASFKEAVNTVTLSEAFDKTNSSKVLFYASIITAVFTYCYYLMRRLIAFKAASSAFIGGTKTSLAVCFILILAWIFFSYDENRCSNRCIYFRYNQKHEFSYYTASTNPIYFLCINCILHRFFICYFWINDTISCTGNYRIKHAGRHRPSIISYIYLLHLFLGGGIFGNQSSPVADTTIMAATAANLPHPGTCYITIILYGPGGYFCTDRFIHYIIFPSTVNSSTALNYR